MCPRRSRTPEYGISGLDCRERTSPSDQRYLALTRLRDGKLGDVYAANDPLANVAMTAVDLQ